MQSHRDKATTIRVVDAAYLLAGIEPQSEGKSTPPLIAHFLNLIHEKTGAVKFATMPDERMEITQAEFQTLKAEYGLRPAKQPVAVPKITALMRRDFIPWINFDNPGPGNHAAYTKARHDLNFIDQTNEIIRFCETSVASTDGELKESEQTIAVLKAGRDFYTAKLLLITSLQSATKSQATTPSPAPVAYVRVKRRSWWDFSPYIIEIMQAGQYATAKKLFKALEAKAGPNSPFEKGTGDNHSNLFIRELAKPLKLKTLQNNWKELREEAAKK